MVVRYSHLALRLWNCLLTPYNCFIWHCWVEQHLCKAKPLHGALQRYDPAILSIDGGTGEEGIVSMYGRSRECLPNFGL